MHVYSYVKSVVNLLLFSGLTMINTIFDTFVTFLCFLQVKTKKGQVLSEEDWFI